MTNKVYLPKYASDYPEGYVVKDYTDPESGLRVIVRVGYSYTFCAYIGAPAAHCMADIEELSFPCHRGITYSAWGSECAQLPKDWYWWGWDYCHAGDRMECDRDTFSPEAQALLTQFDENLKKLTEDLLGEPGAAYFSRKEKRWTDEEVFIETLDVLANLKQSLSQAQSYSSLVNLSM